MGCSSTTNRTTLYVTPSWSNSKSVRVLNLTSSLISAWLNLCRSAPMELMMTVLAAKRMALDSWCESGSLMPRNASENCRQSLLISRDQRGADPRVRLVLDVLAHSPEVGAYALVQLDEIQVLHHISLLQPQPLLHMRRGEQGLQVHEEVVHAPIRHGPRVEGQHGARGDVPGVSDLAGREEGVEDGHETGQEVAPLDDLGGDGWGGEHLQGYVDDGVVGFRGPQ